MNLKNLNVKYALVNIGFMLMVSGSLGFAYNYLSQSGFDAGTIGTVMSVVSLGGVFLGPAAGSPHPACDRHRLHGLHGGHAAAQRHGLHL